MKLKKIAIANKVLLRLYRVSGIPFPISCKLFMLKKKLQPFIDLQAEMENSILKEKNAIGEDGTINMTAEIRSKFADILDSDVEYEENQIDLPVNAEVVEKLGITGEVIDQLDGFVNFIYEE